MQGASCCLILSNQFSAWEPPERAHPLILSLSSSAAAAAVGDPNLFHGEK